MATAQTGPRLTIRPAGEEDAVGLREIFNEAVQDGLTTYDTEPRSIEEQRRLIAQTEQDTRHPLLVAELRGWVAGWISLQPCDRRPQFVDISEVTVFVRREFRNYGLGRQLMKAMEEEAQRLGYRKLVGHVLADNLDSLRLCRATGWREVGRLERHARREGRLRDVVLVEYLVPQGQPV
jgi:L-amino acid N-acyltransferase YncA